MRIKCLLTLSCTLLMCATALATSPCMPPTKAWFTENIIQKSNLVVYGEVVDYSQQERPHSPTSWTKIHVIKTLHGDKRDSTDMLIQGWQAYFQPLYIHQKGDYLLLWLNVEGEDISITDLSWKDCVPSVWSAQKDGTVFDSLGVFNKSSAQSQALSLQEIEKQITEVQQ